ncbi:hypothetical protein J132_09101 [Termitomyces sp. J132]|nr:hypothetical protein J132_09101 [Termitomyces sp. J132]
MLSIAKLNIRNLYDNAAEFILSHSPTWSPVAQPSESSASNPESLTPFSMRREFDATKHELAKSQAEVARLEERCRMLEKTLKETREMLRVRDAELEKTRQEREKDPSPLRNGRSTSAEQDRALMLAGSEEERARIRSTELYMTRSDSWSGAQVLQAVHDINSEILQFAASATELCSFTKNSRSSSARSVQAMHDTSSRLGPNLARILSNRDHSQDPILVQLALQGCVATCIARALSSFCMGTFEAQPTASKWRALTHRHIHTIHPHIAESSINDLSDSIFRWSSDIFTVAGCLSYENGATSSKDGLRLRFGDQVRRIANSVTRLARVTREDILSTCFDVISVNANAQFDSGKMSDAFGDYVASRGAIIATTELGLRCTTRLRESESSEAHDDVTLEQRTILQPKVVLESVLDVLEPR